jgi:hypothetical protein
MGFHELHVAIFCRVGQDEIVSAADRILDLNCFAALNFSPFAAKADSQNQP